MDWVKRNLYFLIGGIVALLLMGLAGWYLFSNYQLNNQMIDKLNEQYSILNELNNKNPHPGNPGKGVDNIQEAKNQQQQLHEVRKKTTKYFQRIPSIPDSTNANSQEFTSALSSTINRLQRDATNTSVGLPSAPTAQGYNFSFESVRHTVTFLPANLGPLSTQLGEIKNICDVLLQAKVNAIDNLRRERVATNDYTGPASDFLGEKSVTNDIGVLTPYEITFRCFTPELASVLAGFSSSPYALIVKTFNIELAPPQQTTESGPTTPAPYVPVFVPGTGATPQPRSGVDDAMARRYGLGGKGRYESPMPTPQPVQPQVVLQPAPAANKGGLPTVLDERQLKVTMLVNVIKPLPSKSGKQID